FLHDNKDWLLAILSTVSPVLQFVQKERDRRAEKEKAKRDPLTLTLEVDGKVVTLTSNAEDAAKLLEHFQSVHPQEAKRASPQSNVKIKVHVPKKKSRHTH